MKKLHVIEKRLNVPGDWIIINAPRPIPGDIQWQGDFRHGIFYAALNPDDPNFASNYTEAEDLDAWELRYYTINEAREILMSKSEYQDFKADLQHSEDIRGIFNYAMNQGLEENE